MIEGLYIAASGGTKQLKKLDALSNNIANINTQGFKRDMLLYEEKTPPFQRTSLIGFDPNNIYPFYGSDPAVSYVQVTQSRTDFTQGSLIKTDNPLDVALEGEGFFVIDTPFGERYTRNGNFHMDEIGQLVDREGNVIQTLNEEPVLIPIGTRRVTIDPDGTLFGGTDENLGAIGQLRIVKFDDPRALTKEGEGFYTISDPTTQAKRADDVKVLQGFTESSNANAVHEMIQMIEAVRTLEAYQKIIQSIDEADDQSVNNLARVA